MKYIFILLLFIVSCKKPIDSENDKTKFSGDIDYNVALKFINDYNKDFFNPHIKTSEWLSRNKMVTKNLVDRYKQMVDSAEIDDPELGLDFDPIISGQDSDEQGFEIKEIDSLNGYVTVQGKSYSEYKIVLKLIEKNGVTLVEGSGVINIPKSRQPKY